MTYETQKEARYQAIAFAIAKRIMDKDLAVGDKLRGRTILASEYGVSSETIRKAINLLAQEQIVDVIERSGIIIRSTEAAQSYVEKYLVKHSHITLISRVESSYAEVKRAQSVLDADLKSLIRGSKTQVFPFQYFAYTVPKSSALEGQTIKDSRFQSQTGGLIIGIDDGQAFIQNPPVNFFLEAGMVIYILGDETVQEKVEQLYFST
jgi:DNA-binding GntR family transcriptional regulator